MKVVIPIRQYTKLGNPTHPEITSSHNRSTQPNFHEKIEGTIRKLSISLRFLHMVLIVTIYSKDKALITC